MTKVTLDTSISAIEEIDEKSKAYLASEHINTLGELLMYNPFALYRRLSGAFEKATITDSIHKMGFVFVSEDGFLEQLRAHLLKKYNITNFNLSTFSTTEKSALLDYKLYELLAFLPDNNGRNFASFCVEAKYSSLTLQEALAHGHVNKKNTFLYNEQLTSWYGYIRSLGFEFSENEDYEAQMSELTKAKESAKKDGSYDLDTKIQTLNTFVRIFRKGEELSSKDISELIDIKGLLTLRDIICIDDEYYSKLPEDLLARIKRFLNTVDIPFIGDENFAEFKKQAQAGAEILNRAEAVSTRTKIKQRFNYLSEKATDLMEKVAILEYDNYSLDKINILLTDLIEELEDIKSQAQFRGQ